VRGASRSRSNRGAGPGASHDRVDFYGDGGVVYDDDEPALMITAHLAGAELRDAVEPSAGDDLLPRRTRGYRAFHFTRERRD
jgi:hypothetical protein